MALRNIEINKIEQLQEKPADLQGAAGEVAIAVLFFSDPNPHPPHRNWITEHNRLPESEKEVTAAEINR